MSSAVRDDLTLAMKRFYDEHPALWNEIAAYHRWAIYNELWNEADRNALHAKKPAEFTVWERAQHWIGGLLTSMASATTEQQVARMVTDPRGYFDAVRAEAKREAVTYVAEARKRKQ